MAKDIIIDQIAIWRPKLTDGFSIKKIAAGMTYREAGTAVYKKSEKVAFRYAKNYELKKAGRFCLFVRTFAEAGVEQQLNKISKKITAEEVRSAIAKGDLMDFDYTNFNLEDK